MIHRTMSYKIECDACNHFLLGGEGVPLDEVRQLARANGWTRHQVTVLGVIYKRDYCETCNSTKAKEAKDGQ